MLFDGNSDEVTEFRARLPPQVDEGSIVLSGGAYGEEGVVKTTTIKALLDTTKGSKANQSEIDALTTDGNTTTEKSHDKERWNKDDEAESDELEDVYSDEH
ncbi:unnamed protein product [Cuscuta campestris]|uniref:Uncharacterized protein n=1 Tax=Cuscuta campestris TaxID=132261 RepID=A0A484KXS4_9ASTE|nr:unnamed protein product [Cuscuta campestris]